ncbi:MAG: MFS transporter [Dysgonamonadaceae bacterium]|jgi:FHS family L-fucose permease-like MFS transporter|nr:MFS transporter [Dysgonamonadaceae bacterium]
MTQQQKKQVVPIIMMVLLFGMISFVTNLAAPMGIVLKNQFGLSNFLGLLGNAANFIAYAVMGIPGGILLSKIGYKKTALIAIAIGFVGVGIQYLSGHFASFGIYLLGAFIAGFSMCLLNTVVNPMLNTLGGGGNKGNQLIQVGGSFNSIMATITPMFVGILIGEAAKAKITDIFPVMYIAMAVFAIVFFVLLAVSIPEPNAEKATESLSGLMKGALSFRHFILGAFAIFVYVGVEVGTPGIANLYMTTYTSEQADGIVNEYQKQQSDEIYLNALSQEDESNKDTNGYESKVILKNVYEKAQQVISQDVKPGLGISTGIAGTIVGFYWLLMLFGRLIGASIGNKVSSKKMMTYVSLVGCILVLLAMFIPTSASINISGLIGKPTVIPLSIAFLILVGLCTSIMWGGIFNLAVEGLGKYLAAASGIFMVLVCGGGILPALQGFIADIAGYMNSYWVIVISLVYLLYYALIGSKNINKNIPVD